MSENEPIRRPLEVSRLTKLRTAFHVATSANYDATVSPQAYEQHVQGETGRRDILARRVVSFLKQEVPIIQASGQTSRVLDLAAGTGIISRAEAAAGYDVTATDVSRNALQYLREQAPDIDTVVANMNEPLPFADGAFDAATSVWANRFIADTELFLEETKRVLNEQGVLIWPIFFMEQPHWKKKAGLKQPTSLGSLARQVRKHGFTDVTTVAQPFYANLYRKEKDGRAFAAPSYIIARK